ncbi:ATP-binding protein [Mycoplasmopsis opalescens]|uniref:ATP-binding protein n=1 Tax=Mycoplasmopsis opalescens TaxID=114886 RepID=UPI0004A6E440|nr:ATP-binding protein [Mycoplasmopsis opalescens]
MIIKRDVYLKKIISKMNNGLVKIITGIRRCGKSFLLNNIFYSYLISIGIDKSHIIQLSMDKFENEDLLDAKALYHHILNQIKDENQYYIFIDEIQEVKDFFKTLNSLMQYKNIDLYVTGSNSKMLSNDIATEFRGRGDQIHLYPLSFSEFYSAFEGVDFDIAFDRFITYGSLPFITKIEDTESKIDYLKNLSKEVYLKDIESRYQIKNKNALTEILNYISSNIGSLTSPLKLANYFKSNRIEDISRNTVENYLLALEDSFLIYKSTRYDIKGKKYIASPYKYYFCDMGLRNERINFRQIEPTHIMENIIYNELKVRGYQIDVGVVEINEKNQNNTYSKKNIEIDFVANRGNNKIYIQSAFSLWDPEKISQEKRPLNKVNDSFKKVIIVRDNIELKRDENGIIIVGLKSFLVNENILEVL